MVLVLQQDLTGWWLDQSLLTLRRSSTRAQNDQTILSRHADEVEFLSQEPRSCGLRETHQSLFSVMGRIVNPTAGQTAEPTLTCTQASLGGSLSFHKSTRKWHCVSQYLLSVVPVTLKEDFGCHRAIKSFWLQNILHNFMYLKIHTSIMFLLQIISKTKIGSGAGSWPNFQNDRS